MLFGETSALVPLCRNEDRSQLARKLWSQFSDRNVWSPSVVEIASTFARLERERALTEISRIKTERRLRLIENDWNIVEPTDRQIELARTFPSTYGLKALDSLQLAAALVWCKEFPKNKDFVSGDGKLLNAAESAGFTVHDLS